MVKNLANCTPREFLKQTNLIRVAVEKFITVNDIRAIRAKVPKLKEDMTIEERKKAFQEQGIANFSEILHSMMEIHPDETLDVLALACFVDPEDVDSHPMDYYLQAVGDMMNSEGVISFFTSFQRLANRNTLKP